jgi:hypothetical protein
MVDDPASWARAEEAFRELAAAERVFVAQPMHDGRRRLSRARADSLDQVRRWRTEFRPRGRTRQGSGEAN